MQVLLQGAVTTQDLDLVCVTLSIYQYVKILTCVCVCEWRKWDVHGAGLTIVMRDLRTLLNLELREECSRAGIQLGLQADADAGSSSRSGHNRGAAAEADASGEQQLKRCNRAWEQQLIRSRRKRRAAAEADAIGEQQLCRESCPAPDYSR